MVNLELITREPNMMIFKFKRIMSFIFLAANLVSFLIYASKIYPLKLREIGFMKALLFGNIFCLSLYNFLYSCGSQTGAMASFLDKFISSLMMSLVLFLNLVLIDAQTSKINFSFSNKSYEGLTAG